MSKIDKSVCVIGLGYVGLPSAAVFAAHGYRVFGYDKNQIRIDQLKADQVSHLSIEEDVADLVQQMTHAGQLSFVNQVVPADVFVICVPTPIADNREPDVSMVENAADVVASVLTTGNLVLLESTSPVGTTRNVIAKKVLEAGFDPEQDIDIAYCPERVFPGESLNEIICNNRVVGGLTQNASERASQFYGSFSKGQIHKSEASIAEFSKLAENTYRDVNIALANTFAAIAEDMKIDVQEVIRIANLHQRVQIHKPGPGVGGHCIPVDPWFLIHGNEDKSGLLSLSRRINDQRPIEIANKIRKLDISKDANIAVLGLAYRGGVDDCRDAPSLQLISELLKHDYNLSVHDPVVKNVKDRPEVEALLLDKLPSVLKDADVVVIMTDHDDYKHLSFDSLDVKNTVYCIDPHNILPANALSSPALKKV